jgi:4-amino-4-deoxy-L-arabinose transferase-like glycosyltransferase
MDKASLTVRHFLQRIRLFIRHNKLEFFLLVVILAIGAFCRLYRISEYMTFLGDEGRDAIVVRRLLVNGDPILVGPGTSIGNMYLGPLYYYFIAPFLWLFQYSPVGPSVLIAIVGVLTIFLLWFASREWFGSTGALGASLLYALSPTIIIYSRSSWNPNIMPFFALLTAYGVWRIWRNASYPWFIISGISFAFVLQSHYLGLLLAPFLLVFVFLAFWNAKKLHRLRSFFLYASTGPICLNINEPLLVIVSFILSPGTIFDLLA